METFIQWCKEVANIVVPIGGGITVGAVILAIGCSMFKGFGNRLINKIDINAIQQKTEEDTIGHIKEIAFTQTIEPLVKSELQKVHESCNAEIEDRYKKLEQQNNNLIEIIGLLTNIFNGSMGMTEELRKAIDEKIEQAKHPVYEPQTITVVEYVEKPTEKKEEKAVVIK